MAVRVDVRIDDDLTNATQVQPLSGKIVDQGTRRPRIGEHPLHLLLERCGLRQLAALGGVEQPVVWNAVPQEEGQARGELEIRQSIRGRPGSFGPGNVPMHAQQEIRIDEHALECELNSRIEAAAFPSPIVEKWQERLHICGCRRASVGQARDLREDLRRALTFVGHSTWFADENRTTAGRILR